MPELSCSPSPASVSQVEQLGSRQLMDAIPDAVVIVDAAGLLIVANKQAETLFGYTIREMLDQPLNLLLPERFHLRHQALVTSYMAQPHVRAMGSRLDLVGLRKDGHEIPLEISLSPLTLDGRLAVVAAIRDITERRNAEQMKEDFIETAGHALRTPLTALRGYVDTLVLHTRRGKGPSLAEWQLEAIEEIDHAAERLEALAQALLDVTTIHAGQLVLRREPQDLVALVRRIVAQRKRLADSDTFMLRAPAEPLVASIDVRRIEQVLLHLVANAVKYSPSGGQIDVAIRHHPTRQEAIISVRDHGVGIAPEQRECLFTRYGGHENAAGVAGTGLSLYLCRQFIERHDGHIGVRSGHDKGATFWFTLPLEQNADEEHDSQNGYQEHTC
jgi:two-component system phosphate regulon sensor histidine kinase PhoR